MREHAGAAKLVLEPREPCEDRPQLVPAIAYLRGADEHVERVEEQVPIALRLDRLPAPVVVRRNREVYSGVREHVEGGWHLDARVRPVKRLSGLGVEGDRLHGHGAVRLVLTVVNDLTH